MLRLALSLCLTAFSLAQVVTFGVKGGVPLTQAFAAQLNPQFPDITINSSLPIQIGQAISSATERTLPYVVGPAVGVHLAGPLFASR